MNRLEIMVDIIKPSNIGYVIYILKYCARFGHAICDLYNKNILNATFGTNFAGLDNLTLFFLPNKILSK